MFTINEDLSIYITRGDVAFFTVSAMHNETEKYLFQAGDIVRFKVFDKKDCENVVLQKDFTVTKETEKVEIVLESADTKLGEVISKPKDYWYEVELNPLTTPQTIIGYDDDGAKILKLFPEGNDVDPNEDVQEGSDGYKELIDIRLDAYGTLHEKAGDSVRAQVQILEGKIKDNTDEIARVFDAVLLNGEDIEKNAEGIERITAACAEMSLGLNKANADIEKNAADIEAIAEEIDNMKESINNLAIALVAYSESAKANYNTNAGNIGANAENITLNAGNIGANAESISQLQNDLSATNTNVVANTENIVKLTEGQQALEQTVGTNLTELSNLVGGDV